MITIDDVECKKPRVATFSVITAPPLNLTTAAYTLLPSIFYDRPMTPHFFEQKGSVAVQPEMGFEPTTVGYHLLNLTN